MPFYPRRKVLQRQIKLAQLAREPAGLQKGVESESEFLLLRLCRAGKRAVVAEIDALLTGKIIRRAGKLRVNERQIPVRRGKAHAALQAFNIARQRGD